MNSPDPDFDPGTIATRSSSPVDNDQLWRSAASGRAMADRWRRLYRRRVVTTDTVVIVAAVALAAVGRFHLLPQHDSGSPSWTGVLLLSTTIAATWLIALDILQSRDVSLVGIGSEEYRRIVSATVWVFGVIAVVSLVLRTEVSRGYLLIALPFGLAGLIIGRHLLRRNLAKRRTNGEFLTRVVVLGRPDSIDLLCACLNRSGYTGYALAGACIPAHADAEKDHLVTPLGTLPILGDENSVEAALSLTGADALAVAATEHLGHEKMRKLAWRLDSLGVDMIVVPGMADIAGPRLKLRPIDNLPLFHISKPRFDGPPAYAKRLFDIVFAIAALMVALPVIAAAAVAIKLEDGGPVMFRQERVGRHGKHFRIFKLRTMTVDAEARKSAEIVVGANGSGVFFKSANDSRITRVGSFLRRTSIDELPQLFNVLGGAMSVVGPRPLVPGEGEGIEDFVQQRGVMKPGITGLWQISGRSDVSDEERIRLDLCYVGNWSSVQDLVIVWRTVRTVLKRDGAY